MEGGKLGGRLTTLPSLLYLINSSWELRAGNLQKMGLLFQNTQDMSAEMSLNASPDPLDSAHSACE